MASVRYEFDEANRLMIHDVREALQPRRVVEGRVTIDGRNRLQYRARRAPGTAGRAAVSDVLLDGVWRLSPRHELGMMLHPTQTHDRQELFVRGSIVEATANALVVSLAQRQGDGRLGSQRVALSGRWQADERNRLTFLVAKSDGTEDRLVFDGAWEVNQRRQLVYRYEQPSSGRRRAVRTLTLSGAWGVSTPARLAYRLSASDRSALLFEAAVQRADASAGRLDYTVGVRLSTGRTIRRTVTLFGQWTLRRNLSVSFELASPDGRRRRLAFQGALGSSDRRQLTVRLSQPDGGPLGASVTFSRAFLKNDARWFARLQRDDGDTQLLGGLQVRF